MKALGFELALRARRLPPRLPSSIVVSVVRLRDVPSTTYSVPPGTVGVVENSTEDGSAHFVSWVTGGGSGPILDDDLLRLGEVSVAIEDKR